jgi:hypothetical protein
LLAPVFLASSLTAQTVQGDLVGTIRDSQGGTVPGAKIRVINEGTGAVRELQSDERGDFLAIGFFVGSYRVEVEKDGFKKSSLSGIGVQPVAVKRVDVVLEIGQLTETVTVTEAAATVSTEGPTINYGLPRLLYDKPISDFSRSGWVLDPAMWAVGSAGGSNGLFLWGGVAGSQHELQVEGGQQSVAMFINPNSVQEVSIVTGAPPAEYARASNVNTTFKSGTNALHGEYAATLAHNRLNARLSPAGPTGNGGFVLDGKRKTGLPRWRHEISIGGPVFIPKVYDGRNKTFFFFDWHQPRGTSVEGPGRDSIPTSRMRSGDFSRFSVQPRDPATGTPFPGGVIPTARISSVARAIIGDFYTPYRYVGDPESFVNNAEVLGGNFSAEQRKVFKFDQNVGTKDVITFSYQYQTRTGGQRYPPGQAQAIDVPQNRWSAGHTHTFSPRLISQLRLSALRDIDKRLAVADMRGVQRVYGADVLRRWGIGGVTPTGFGGWPVIRIQNWLIRGGSAAASYQDSARWDTRYQFNENLTYILGRHSLKGGVSGIKSLFDTIVNPGFGDFLFDGRFTGEPFADFLLGLPGNFSRSLPRVTEARRIWEYGAFIQDDFRVNSKLSLSFGVRWDHFTAPYDKNGLYFNFDLASGKIVVPDQKALSNVSPAFRSDLIPIVVGRELNYPDKLRESNGRILPRLGIAYRPTGNAKLVVRGGYGVYNGALRFSGLQTGGPFGVTEAFVNRAEGGPPLYSWPNAFPGIGRPASAATGASVARNFRPEYTQTWNVSVEQELFKNWGLRLSYLGNASRQMGYAFDANTPLLSSTPFSQNRRPYPAFQSVTRQETGAVDSYKAFQIVFRHPLRAGLYVEVGFTEQRSWNDLGNGGYVGGQRESGAFQTIDYAYNRGRDRARSTIWPDHDFLVNYAYELPFGRGKRFAADLKSRYGAAGSLLNAVVGGWSATGYFNWHSGNYFTPRYTGADPGNIAQFSGRADVVPGCDPYTKVPLNTTRPYFNQSCFKIPANGTLGNARLNSLIGPGQWIFSISPQKEFGLPAWEGAKVRLGANMYNALNHPAYNIPSGIINSPAGALLGGTSFVRRATEAAGQRVIVVTARFIF